jgi:hypothetical protein
MGETQHVREIINLRKISFEEPEEMRRLGSPRSRYEDNVTAKRKDAECGMDFTGTGQNPVQSSCEHDSVLSGSIKDGNVLDR